MPLYIKENFTATLRKKLRIGELDAVIIALPFTEPDVLTRPVYDEHFEVLLPADHPWNQKDNIAVEALADETLLLLGTGHCFRDQILGACPLLTNQDVSSPSHDQIEASSLETIRHMVASGMGISVLPQSAMGNYHYESNILSERPFSAPAPGRTVAIAWRASFPRPKVIDALSDALRLCSLDGPANNNGKK